MKTEPLCPEGFMGRDHLSPFAAAHALRSIALPDICRVPDLANHTRMSPTAIRRAFRRGVIPGRKIGGRWLTSRQAVLAALSERQVVPPDSSASAKSDAVFNAGNGGGNQ